MRPADRTPDVAVSTLALALVTGFGPFGVDAYLPALPTVAGDLHTSASSAQATITVFLVGLAVGQLIAGPVSDAVGRRRLVVGGAIALVLASLTCVLSPTIATLLVARAVQGLAAGNGAAIGVAIVTDRFSGAEAAARFGTLSAIRLVAPVVAPAIGGVILLFSNYRGVFAFMAALSVVVLLIAVLRVPETLPAVRRQAGGVKQLIRRSTDLLEDAAFRAPVIVQCLATAGFFVYIGGSSFVLQQDLRVSESLYAVIFATDAAAMVGTSVLFRVLVHRVPTPRLRGIGLLMSSGAAAVLLVIELLTGDGAPLPVVWVLLAVSVAGNGFCIPATTVLAQEAGRRSSGTAASLSGGLAFLVGALITPLTGVIGVQTVLVMTSAMMLLSGAALLVSAPRSRTAGAREAGTGVLR